MKERKINCYFCGYEATQIEEYNNTRNIMINCPKCKKFELARGAIKFYLKRKDGKIILTKEDKESLSKYVQKNYNEEDDKPVFINTKVIEAVRGKVSINEC